MWDKAARRRRCRTTTRWEIQNVPVFYSCSVIQGEAVCYLALALRKTLGEGMASGTIDCTGSASSDCVQTTRVDGVMGGVLGGRMVPDAFVTT